MAEGLGSLSYVGIGIEGTVGTPVRAQSLADFRSAGMKPLSSYILSQSIRNRRSFDRVVPGSVGMSGDLVTELQPEGANSKLLYALLGTPTTVTGGGIATHTFKTVNSVTPVGATILVNRGQNDLEVFYGSVCMSAEFNCAIDEIVLATWSLLARQSGIYQYSADEYLVKNSAAAYDGNAPMTFVGAQLKIAGATTSDARSARFRINNSTIPKVVVKRQRQVEGHLHQDSVVEGSIDLYFNGVAELRRWLGNAGSTFPFKHSETTILTTGTISLEMAGDSGAATEHLYLQTNTAFWTDLDQNIGGRGPIMQTINFQSLYDADDVSDVIAELTNGEAAAAITTAGTNITSVP